MFNFSVNLELIDMSLLDHIMRMSHDFFHVEMMLLDICLEFFK